MELKVKTVAGTQEAGDVMVNIGPNPGKGLAVQLNSKVLSIFGKAIEKTVREVLEEFDVNEAVVEIHDMGALDYVIRARMQCAICRSAKIQYDWRRERFNVQ